MSIGVKNIRKHKNDLFRLSIIQIFTKISKYSVLVMRPVTPDRVYFFGIRFYVFLYIDLLKDTLSGFFVWKETVRPGLRIYCIASVKTQRLRASIPSKSAVRKLFVGQEGSFWDKW